MRTSGQYGDGHGNRARPATSPFRGLHLTPATVACLAWEMGTFRGAGQEPRGLLRFAQSRANASIGLSRAALRAGTKPNTMPISVEQMKAVTIELSENTIFHSLTSSENT